MGKLQVFQISFAENKTVYFPGNTVSGQLTVQLNSPMDMTALKIKFAGKAHVHWTESHGSGNNQRTVHYSATEKLFEQGVTLYGKGAVASQDRNTLGQGSHSFPFNFQLPMDLPTSFEDHIGYIRYFVKATIDKPWKFDHNTKAAFTVLDMLDLNAQVTSMMAPSGGSDNKTLCCWCCSSGPIEVEVQTDRTGYVAGEWVIVNATITNSSNSTVEATSAELVQTVTYRATSKTKTVPKTVNKIMGKGCGPHGSVTWTNERIHIPPLPPSESTHCSIIDISYSIMLRAHLRTCAVDLRVHAPIVIGTVPLRNLEMYGDLPPSFPPAPEPSAPAMQPSVLPPMPEPSTMNSTAPPPSYAAATGASFSIKDDDDNNYTMGDMNYAPQYTYYDWSQSAFTYN